MRKLIVLSVLAALCLPSSGASAGAATRPKAEAATLSKRKVAIPAIVGSARRTPSLTPRSQVPFERPAVVQTGRINDRGPRSIQAADLMPGWNLGNSLEAVGSGEALTASQETSWGNPVVNQQLFNSVKAAGFRSVRIPVAWSQYADDDNNIRPFWLARVKQVVDYTRNAGLYVMINIHWDGGWLQSTTATQSASNAKLTKLWTQIANHFKDYDEHLIFAGMNEVGVSGHSAPTAENCTVHHGYNQTFVNAVRATGGNNANRYLAVQGYWTNIDYTLTCNSVMPTDSVASRLMMEVHYYDPWNFAGNANSSIWQWGATATDPAVTETWANEAWVDQQMLKMKTNFIDKGVPVILGEYGAIIKSEYDAAQTYRNRWNRYISGSAKRHGLIPMYWDNGYLGNHEFGLFDRNTGAQGHPATIDAIVNAN